MSYIWELIDELNPLDKMVVYGTILQGVSAREAYRKWISSKDMQGPKCFPLKVRRGEEPVPGWILEKVKELESQIEKEGIRKI